MDGLTSRSRSSRYVLLTLMLMSLGTGCASSEAVGSDVATPEETSASAESSGDEHGDELTAQLEALPIAELTAEEIDGLLWIREEEKLAHDVYVALHELWGAQIFENISESETTHTESVRALLERHAIDDPAAELAEGVFSIVAIQELYDELTAQGAESLVAALRVGAFFEEMDIMDLRARASDQPDITLVYDNLERGSRNHLRAFIRNLEKQGETYIPTLMPANDFQEIVSTPTERGDGTTVAADEHDESEEGAGGGRGHRGGRSG